MMETALWLVFGREGVVLLSCSFKDAATATRSCCSRKLWSLIISICSARRSSTQDVLQPQPLCNQLSPCTETARCSYSCLWFRTPAKAT